MSEVPVFENPESDVPAFPPAEEPPPTPTAPPTFSLFWPFVVVIVTLVGSDIRDIITIRESNVQTYKTEKRLEALLSNAGMQARAVEMMKGDLTKLSVSDPVAGQILNDFFPKPAAAPHAPVVNPSYATTNVALPMPMPHYSTNAPQTNAPPELIKPPAAAK